MRRTTDGEPSVPGAILEIIHWSFSQELNIETVASAAACLLQSRGLGRPPLHATSIPGGGNNRVFKIESAEGNYLLKSYFESAGGKRDRLASDYAFCRFAWDAGLRAVPQPIAVDPPSRLAVYEFVQGQRLAPREVAARHVDDAIQFVVDLNRVRDSEAAKELPIAAEACFSVSDHLACVARRVARLRGIDESEPLHQKAAAFVRDDLAPRWRDIANEVESVARALPSDVSLATAALSPSDFGFHNALLQDDGQLRFFDFEYAGWDDPAKLVCDFFCQAEVPVPIEFWDRFLERILAHFPSPQGIATRARLLLSVYRIKWCCIMLNEFLPAENQRRRFADPSGSDYERKERQLNRVLVRFKEHLATT
jgi:hypothetical protein